MKRTKDLVNEMIESDKELEWPKSTGDLAVDYAIVQSKAIQKCMHLDAEMAYRSLSKQETLEEFSNDKQTANSIKADASMKILKMIEEAHKKGCSLKLMWMRNKYVWIMVKD